MAWLEQYQLHAKDVLAAAFLRGKGAPESSPARKALYRMAGRLEGEAVPIPDQL